MPNWCSNQVTIYHPERSKIQELIQAIEDGEDESKEWAGFCNFVCPVPEPLRDERTSSHGGDDAEVKDQLRKQLQEKFGYESWYDFCIHEWGTKWEIRPDQIDSNVEENIEDGANYHLALSFDSAWAPPIGIYDRLLDEGFSVRASYYEPGAEFCGIWEDGYDDCRPYSGATSKTVRNVVGSELDDIWGISESMAFFEEEEDPYPEATQVVEWLEEGGKEKGLPKLTNKGV